MSPAPSELKTVVADCHKVSLALTNPGSRVGTIASTTQGYVRGGLLRREPGYSFAPFHPECVMSKMMPSGSRYFFS